MHSLADMHQLGAHWQVPLIKIPKAVILQNVREIAKIHQ